MVRNLSCPFEKKGKKRSQGVRKSFRVAQEQKLLGTKDDDFGGRDKEIHSPVVSQI